MLAVLEEGDLESVEFLPQVDQFLPDYQDTHGELLNSDFSLKFRGVCMRQNTMWRSTELDADTFEPECALKHHVDALSKLARRTAQQGRKLWKDLCLRSRPLNPLQETGRFASSTRVRQDQRLRPEVI